MEFKYEPIKFNSWQELAKCVMDGGEVYYEPIPNNRRKIYFSGNSFNCDIERVFSNWDTCIKKQQTLKELLKIRPRLCWVWDNTMFKPREIALITGISEGGRYEAIGYLKWDNAKLLTDIEIKNILI